MIPSKALISRYELPSYIVGVMMMYCSFMLRLRCAQNRYWQLLELPFCLFLLCLRYSFIFFPALLYVDFNCMDL